MSLCATWNTLSEVQLPVDDGIVPVISLEWAMKLQTGRSVWVRSRGERSDKDSLRQSTYNCKLAPQLPIESGSDPLMLLLWILKIYGTMKLKQ